MRRNLFALALFGFSLTACDNPPPIVDDVAEESDDKNAGSDRRDSGTGDAGQPD